MFRTSTAPPSFSLHEGSETDARREFHMADDSSAHQVHQAFKDLNPAAEADTHNAHGHPPANRSASPIAALLLDHTLHESTCDL